VWRRARGGIAAGPDGVEGSPCAALFGVVLGIRRRGVMPGRSGGRAVGQSSSGRYPAPRDHPRKGNAMITERRGLPPPLSPGPLLVPVCSEETTAPEG
jgi:hypothetical protein